MTDTDSAHRPNLADGTTVGAVRPGGMVLGRVGDEEVLLARTGDEFFAVGAKCTHYHGALVEGLVVGDTVRCPLHHACFSLRNGEALRAPALDPIACWRVERQGDTVFVREKRPEPNSSSLAGAPHIPDSVIIISGGGAGLTAADTLRRKGYEGPIAIISADDAPPSDRPNLSKDYLAGQAQDDWIPLRAPEYFAERRIELLLRASRQSISRTGRLSSKAGNDGRSALC